MKKSFNFGLAGGLLVLSFLAIVIFRTAKELSISAYIAVIAVYSAVTLTSALWYIIYNRGLAGAKISEDMLPSEWSGEQKNAFMNELEARRKKSKKALIILVPMVATFFFEVLDIYLIQEILELMKK